MNLSKLQEIVEDREAWRAAVHGVTKSQICLFCISAYCNVNKDIIWYVMLNRRIWGTLVSALAHFSKKRSEPFWSLGGLAHSGICSCLRWTNGQERRKLQMRGISPRKVLI